MRKVLFAATCLLMFAAASAASAQEAPVDTEAAEANDCQRPAGRRGVLSQSRTCRSAYSLVRQCEFAVNVRAAALRYASGRCRHVRIASCV
jgi:hypothetical protein